MTKISEYPVIATPELDDLLIGTDANNSDITKNFSIGSIIATIGDINQGPIGPQGNTGPTGPQGPVGPAGLEWQGAWDEDSSYVADDAVGYDGASYFCILAIDTVSNPTPDEDPTHWALLASQGAVGPTGPAGPIGPQGPAGDVLPYTFWRAEVNATSIVRVLYDGIGFTSPTVTNPSNGVIRITKSGFFTGLDNNKLEFTSFNLSNFGQVYITLFERSEVVLDALDLQVYDMTGGQTGTPAGSCIVEFRIYN